MAFNEDDRRVLVKFPRIGPGVVKALESVGVNSIQRLRQLGAEAVVSHVCAEQGSPGFGSRIKAIRRFLTESECNDGGTVELRGGPLR